MNNRQQIKMDSDPMWEALKCSECDEMTFIQHRSSGEFEMYDCSCVKMERELSELLWEMYWDSREGQQHAAVLSSINNQRRLDSEKGWG